MVGILLMLTVMVLGHEEGDASSKKAGGGPHLPFVVTEENLPLVLIDQLEANVKEKGKKHKPLFIALFSRETKGTLEFGREFTKLADTVHR